jgi:hypothetical protein
MHDSHADIGKNFFDLIAFIKNTVSVTVFGVLLSVIFNITGDLCHLESIAGAPSENLTVCVVFLVLTFASVVFD